MPIYLKNFRHLKARKQAQTLNLQHMRYTDTVFRNFADSKGGFSTFKLVGLKYFWQKKQGVCDLSRELLTIPSGATSLNPIENPPMVESRLPLHSTISGIKSSVILHRYTLMTHVLKLLIIYSYNLIVSKTVKNLAGLLKNIFAFLQICFIFV